MRRPTRSGSGLLRPVRPLVVARYLGQLGLVLAALQGVPLLAAVWFGETAFVVGYAGLIAALLPTSWVASRARPNSGPVRTNEALAVVALAFVLSSVLGSIPLLATGERWIDIFFESVSAVTTTGLSVLASVENAPATFLLARAWTQWYGGLGIVALSVALVMRPGTSLQRLGGRSSNDDELVGSTLAHARYSLGVYSALTVAGVGLLLLAGMEPLAALLHGMAAVSTGGFSSYDGSLSAVDGWAARFAVTFVCISGAVSLGVYASLIRGRGFAKAWRDPQVRGLAVLALTVSMLLALLFYRVDGMAWQESVAHGLTMGFSAQTTAGFSTLSVADLSAPAKLVLVFAMMVGGGLGSTAGGIKLYRLIVVARVLQQIIRRTVLPPHAVVHVRVAGRRLDAGNIADAIGLVAFFAVTLVLSWLAFLVYGYAPIDSLFEVASALGTAGLSAGVSAPDLPTPLKLVLCAVMLLGRVEIVALLVVLYPPTWFRPRPGRDRKRHDARRNGLT